MAGRLGGSAARRLGGSAARPLRPQIKDGVVLEYSSTTSSAVPRALISRERVPKSNTGNYKERGNSDPKNMSLRDRIEEFPGENLCLRGGKLFCNWCKEILSSKKSILKKPLGFQKTCRRQREVKSDKKARSCAHMRICHAKDCKTGRWTI